jgi:hypothetical protein
MSLAQFRISLSCASCDKLPACVALPGDLPPVGVVNPDIFLLRSNQVRELLRTNQIPFPACRNRDSVCQRPRALSLSLLDKRVLHCPKESGGLKMAVEPPNMFSRLLKSRQFSSPYVGQYRLRGIFNPLAFY